jgi:hypothetical protein
MTKKIKYQGGGASSYSVKDYQKLLRRKTGKRKRVEKWSTDDVEGKRVTRYGRKKIRVKEKEDMLSDLQSDAAGDNTPTKIKRSPIKYGDKKVTKRRFKSVKDKGLTETKRKEKIVYDDGNIMKKRKQRKIRFGKNKGKIKSKTVTINRGKRTVNKRILDKTDKTKLQTGGFLEAPVPRLFED